MEDELRCFACKQVYCEPVLLPCGHALCRSCAVGLQGPVGETDSNSSSSGSGDYQEPDKLSLLSEADSGVVCGSRPSSFAGTPANVAFSTTTYSLSCPVCNKTVYFDEHGVNNLPIYRVMRTIVERYAKGNERISKSTKPAVTEAACQMCEGERRAAAVRCEQCAVRYCHECREAWHPERGPLAKHVLRGIHETCEEHDLALAIYCIGCRSAGCTQCAAERHTHHIVQPLASAARAQKTELSQILQQLSEQAKSITEYIQKTKTIGEATTEPGSGLEATASSEIECLMRALRQRSAALAASAEARVRGRAGAARAAAAAAAGRLHGAAAYLHFCVEALKDTDDAAFLQVGSLLSARAMNEVESLEAGCVPLAPPPSRLTLDTQPVLDAIANMNFIECMRPGAPQLVPEECAARGNAATLVWRPPPRSDLHGYVLELDDGRGGAFREVYCGGEAACTVAGLHYASVYAARVKAFNAAGDGPYGEALGLQTAPTAHFQWAGGPLGAPGGRARGAGWAHGVALGDAPLARGRHYWQIKVEAYDADTDPAFGVARAGVARDKMLGADRLGWAMYCDARRSWFQHGGAHAGRRAARLRPGARVGVLLDLDRGELRFTLDGRPQGDVAFTGLQGVFYPAISLNRGVEVTLESGLEPPDLEDLELSEEEEAETLLEDNLEQLSIDGIA